MTRAVVTRFFSTQEFAAAIDRLLFLVLLLVFRWPISKGIDAMKSNFLRHACSLVTIVAFCLPAGSAMAQKPIQDPKNDPPSADAPPAAPRPGRSGRGLVPKPENLKVAPLGAGPGSAATPEETAANERAEKFAKYMTGASLKGRFTIKGKDDKMPEETYTISKCEKLPAEDMYRFTARIQYGDTDSELPMEIPVHWAGDTPVISLTNMWLPGLGTFSARVLIYEGAYAGTWSHGEVGGQMFGAIISDQKEDADQDASAESTSTSEAPAAEAPAAEAPADSGDEAKAKEDGGTKATSETVIDN
jgi:hypothetical protein